MIWSEILTHPHHTVLAHAEAFGVRVRELANVIINYSTNLNFISQRCQFLQPF